MDVEQRTVYAANNPVPKCSVVVALWFFFSLFTHLITLDTKHTGLILFLSQSFLSASQKVTLSIVKKEQRKLVPEMLKKKEHSEAGNVKAAL